MKLAQRELRSLLSTGSLLEPGKKELSSRALLHVGRVFCGLYTLASFCTLNPSGALFGTVGMMGLREGLKKPIKVPEAELERVREELARFVNQWAP